MTEDVIQLTDAAGRRHALEDLQAAESGYRRALALAPDFVPALANLGYLCAQTGRLAEAEALLARAVQLEPGHAGAQTNLGFALQLAGRPDEALACYARAVELAPASATARLNHASMLLLDGQFERGWEEYEARWEVAYMAAERRDLGRPMWKGEDLAGRTILLHAEQGFGDTLQFARYAALVAARGATVVLEVQRELLRLMRSLAGVTRLVAAGDELGPFDLYCPLMSLPRVMGTRIESIPAQVPYLAPEPGDAAFWTECTKHSGGLRVGLAWSGAPRRQTAVLMRANRRRSIPLAELAPLAAIPGVQYYSLQLGEGAQEALQPPAGMDLIDLTDAIGDFADTAAFIENLDLVVTVDTAIAHLAGALGKPVWVLSRIDGCWRWLRERSDSPWYPSLRVYRQRAPGNWQSVISEVASDLRALAQRPRSASIDSRRRSAG